MNLVSNGTFDDTSSWNLTRVYGNYGQASSNISGGTWNFGAGLYGGGTYSLSQNIQTVSGDTYTLEFDSTAFANWGYISARVFWNNVQFYINNGQYGYYSSAVDQSISNLIATSQTTALTFIVSGALYDSNRPGIGFSLDNVSVYSNTPHTVSAVPEPETLAMMLLGLPMMAWTVRRRKSA